MSMAEHDPTDISRMSLDEARARQNEICARMQEIQQMHALHEMGDDEVAEVHDLGGETLAIRRWHLDYRRAQLAQSREDDRAEREAALERDEMAFHLERAELELHDELVEKVRTAEPKSEEAAQAFLQLMRLGAMRIEAWRRMQASA